MSRLSRIRITYDHQNSSSPTTLIVKFHPPEPNLRKFVYEANATEARFYSEIVPQSKLRTPRVYYSAIDQHSYKFVLVLEDLTNYRIVDDIEGCSPEDAATAVQNLAAFHAIWWSNPDLERMDWLKPFDRSFSLELLGKPAATFAGPLPKVVREIAQRVQVHYGHLFEMQSRPPLTIMLNDVKARHMFFGTNSQADEFAIVDFQLVALGRGPLDLSRFFGSSLQPEIRRTHELDLLHMYYDVLTDHGVTGYTFETLFNDYRFGHLHNLVDFMAIEAQGLQERGGSKLKQIQQEQIQRYTASIVDLDCAELLPA